jgi:pimeloyl-ACP methyl ester carboxylesterase
MSTVYAMLVGIDKYLAPVPQLRGCVNDIKAIEAFLENRTQGSTLKTHVLLDAKATRAAVLDGFRTFLTQAGSEDVALFYYSGHGAQENAPQIFWGLEPDRRDETLVLYDSRNKDQFDLADKELSILIAEIAKKNPHIVVVLDCCHSGSGTRAALQGGLRERRAPLDPRERAAGTFIPELASFIADLERGITPTTPSPSSLTPPQGKHILLSACQSSETAKEANVGGQERGAFSAALIEALIGCGPSATYNDVLKRASANIKNTVREQLPQLEEHEGANASQPFLGGKVQATQNTFTVSFEQASNRWVIDGGAIHGVPAPKGNDTTTLAVFNVGATPEQRDDLEQAIGTATVTQAMPSQSAITLDLKSGQPDPQLTYTAIVTQQSVPKLDVSFNGDADGIKALQDALNTAGPQATPSLFVQESGTRDLTVTAQNGTYKISQRGRFISVEGGYSSSNAKNVVAQLEQIARWELTANLSNPGTGLNNQVTLDILDEHDELIPNNQGVTLEYTLKNGTLVEPNCKLRIKNIGQKTLFAAVIHLDESYGIDTQLSPVPGRAVLLEPGQEAFAFGGEAFPFVIPDDWITAGVTQVTDRIKLFTSTERFEPSLLTQDPLDVKAEDQTRSAEKGTRSIPISALEMLMDRVQTRAVGKPKKLSDWAVQDLIIITVRPADSSDIPSPGKSATLFTGVTLEGHPDLIGVKAALTSLPAVARDLQESGPEAVKNLSGRAVPPWLMQGHPEAFDTFSFSPETRGGSPQLQVLELKAIDEQTKLEYQNVTAEKPLVMHVDRKLKPGEYIVPTAFDPETKLHLPLGLGVSDANGVTITIERLPEPAVTTRSLGGSIQILFQKFIAQTLGTAFPYPLLRAATVSEDGKVTYSRPDEVANLAANAKNTLLFVHGIIGDTESMVPCVRPKHFGLELPALNDKYDLILTFDYENINDGIEKAANDLKACLEKAGLGQKRDGRSLKIVAHSMGGLVSRWYIEKLGGNAAIDKLVMLGTPNAGSPWPNVQAWATGMLGVGLNALGTGLWPVRIIGGLLGLIEKVDTNLDEMAPGSSILKALADTPDPGVPYEMIAGDVTKNTDRQAVLEKLLKRLGTVTLFSSQPNDIAVLNSSIVNVNANRDPKPLAPASVACDHMSYFGSFEGIEALVKAL